MNLNSDLYRERGTIFDSILGHALFHSSIFGAYTQMLAGLSSEVALKRPGEWGRSFANIHEGACVLMIIKLLPARYSWKATLGVERGVN